MLLIAAVLSLSDTSHSDAMASAFTCRSQPFRTQFANTKLFDASGENTEKLVIQLLTDDNRDTLLRPAADPNRPILVDAFA